MKCRWCGNVLEQRTAKERLYCNASCRSKAWQRDRREGALEALVRVEKAVLGLRRVLKGDE